MSRISFTDMTFCYHQSADYPILQNLNADFDSSRITLLTGVSGCGKSTLLYLASGIYPENAGAITTGTITIDGENPADMPPNQRCKRVGMMFQNPLLQFCMDTVRNELAFCLENVNTPREEMDSIIEASLNFCNISHLKERELLTLSGGEKQKVMLACLAALSPDWILLDEPFANLDEDSSTEIAAKLFLMHQERGIGIIAVDHRMDYWIEIAQEIKNMDHYGKLLSQDPSLSSDPPYPFHRRNRQGVSLASLEDPLLSLREITVTHSDTPVLHGLNADFQKGEVYAILGSSGSGKSSLFDVLRGLVSFQGAIFYNGKLLKKKALGRPGPMGFVTQNPQDQFIAGTVYDEIRISLKQQISSPAILEQQTEFLLRKIRLWGHRKASPYLLSQGQQRRLGVAAILACGCSILICDEPTYAQDWKNTIAIMKTLEEQVDTRGTTLIFSTHDRKLAEDFADIILELKEGVFHEYH